MIVCLQITDSCIVSWMIYNLLFDLMRIAECHEIKTCNSYVLTHFDVIDWPPFVLQQPNLLCFFCYQK